LRLAANTIAHIYAREVQILAIRMIVLKHKHRTYKHFWKWRCWTTPSTRGGMNSNFGRDFIVIGYPFSTNKYYYCSHVAMQNIDC